MNNKQFIKDFIQNAATDKKQRRIYCNLSCYNNTLFNYSTPLLQIDTDKNIVHFNIRRYSSSTSRIQSHIRNELERNAIIKQFYYIHEYNGANAQKWYSGGVTSTDLQRNIANLKSL